MPLKPFTRIAAAGFAAFCFLFAMAAQAEEKINWRDGRAVFEKCKSCHTFKAGKHRFGPSLKGFFGRQAGTAPDFTYSETMRRKGEAGLVWTDDALDAFLTEPKKFIPKTRMSFPGLKDDKQRRAVIAYVKRRAMR